MLARAEHSLFDTNEFSTSHYRERLDFGPEDQSTILKVIERNQVVNTLPPIIVSNVKEHICLPIGHPLVLCYSN